MVSPLGSFGSSARLPMLFVPSPCPIQRQFKSSVRMASSLRQTPPPAVPAQSRQGPLTAQIGEIASAEMRPEKLPVPLAPPADVLSGPRLVHADPCAWAPR